MGGRGSAGRAGGGGGASSGVTQKDEFPVNGSYAQQQEWGLRNTNDPSSYSKANIEALRKANVNTPENTKLAAILEKSAPGSSITMEARYGNRITNETWKKQRDGDWKFTDEKKSTGQTAVILTDNVYTRVKRINFK